MGLVLHEDETMLVESARGFFAREAPVSAFRELRDCGNPKRMSSKLWQDAAGMGFAAPQLSQEDGGSGMGATAAGLIAEEIGRVLAATPFLSSVLASDIIARAGSSEQKAQLLPGIIDGSKIIAIAIEESARYDPAYCEARVLDGKLSGTKRAVIDGGNASSYLVAALNSGEQRLFLVESSATGVEVKKLDWIDHRDVADVTFSNAAATPLPGNGKAVIARALDLACTVLASELLGMSLEAFERTVAYLKEREQFGRKIGTYQGLQHRAARAFMAIEVTKGVVIKALRALDSQEPDASLLASAAKAIATSTARSMMVEAMQMHGGIGVTDELDIGLFVKRAYVAGAQFGDDRFHKGRLAKVKWGI